MLFVCSVFDKVKYKSLFVTMHETVADAEREFKRTVSQSALAGIKNDLVLYRIGKFDPVSLELTGEDACKLKEGASVETVE